MARGISLLVRKEAKITKILLVLSLGLSGCDKSKEAPSPSAEKFNSPAPITAPTRVDVSNSSPLDALLAPAKMEIPIATSPYAGAGEDFRSGSDASAQVTIVEFSDFECPACETMSTLLHQLREEFPADKVRLVFRNFPLDQSCNPAIRRPMHMNACKVAYLARCAGQNQKFWQFHDAAFKYHAEAATQAETWALALGLTQDEIAACLNSESIKNKVKDDMAWAEKLGVDSTPTLFINNRKFIGPREALSGLIRALLEQ